MSWSWHYLWLLLIPGFLFAILLWANTEKPKTEENSAQQKKPHDKHSDPDDKKPSGFWKTTWNVVWTIVALWFTLTLGSCFLNVGSGIKNWLNKPDPRFSARSAPATPPTETSTTTKEALLPEDVCMTPCHAFVGWNYKVRTNGDDLRIKYHGCSEWFEQPGKEDKPAPPCFQPGDAQFEVAEKSPSVRVQVYKKIQVSVQ